MRALAQRIKLSASAATIMMLVKTSVFAQSFAGDSPDLPGMPWATNAASIRSLFINIIKAILNFLALVAVVIVIVAGIRLIISQGEEEQAGKAKKTILYAIVGLVIVLFARVIVGLITVYLAGQVNCADRPGGCPTS